MNNPSSVLSVSVDFGLRPLPPICHAFSKIDAGPARAAIDHQPDHVATRVMPRWIVGCLGHGNGGGKIDVRVENAYLILRHVLHQRSPIGAKDA